MRRPIHEERNQAEQVQRSERVERLSEAGSDEAANDVSSLSRAVRVHRAYGGGDGVRDGDGCRQSLLTFEERKGPQGIDPAQGRRV